MEGTPLQLRNRFTCQSYESTAESVHGVHMPSHGLERPGKSIAVLLPSFCCSVTYFSDQSPECCSGVPVLRCRFSGKLCLCVRRMVINRRFIGN